MRMLIFLVTVAVQVGMVYFAAGPIPLIALWLLGLGAFAIAMRSTDPHVRRLWRPLSVLAALGVIVVLTVLVFGGGQPHASYKIFLVVMTVTILVQLYLFLSYKPVARNHAPVYTGTTLSPPSSGGRVSPQIVEKWKHEADKLLAEVAEKNQQIRELKTRVAQLEERVARQNRLLAQVDDPFADEPTQSPKGN